MTATVERFAAPLRAEVLGLAAELDCSSQELRAAQAPRVSGLGYALDDADASTRAAWWLMGQWLLGYLTRTLDPSSTLGEAEDWFYGPVSACLPRLAPPDRQVLRFSTLATPDTVAALLPYLLDPLGPGTRRHVLSSETHHPDRIARKAAGVYYTPADVALHMAAAVGPPTRRWTCLDPACGSGVFLRAALRLPNPATRLFGYDIDPLAAEMAAFVVVANRAENSNLSAWSRWHLARMDLATQDALLVEPGTELGDFAQHARREDVSRTQARLAAGGYVAAADSGRPYRSLGALFPSLQNGADVLLSNPPYAKLGFHEKRDKIAQRFTSLATPTATSNVYTAFVEMAWQHTHAGHGAAGVVVPLSVAFHGGQQYRSLRRAMAATAGTWDCSFFDRTPDALFGDDVKTRNAILIFRATKRTRPDAVAVTGLLRWTSTSRPKIFASLRHTGVSSSIADRLPKLGSAAERDLYAALRQLPGSLGDDVVQRAKVTGAKATPDQWPHTLFVGPTAYNWFNCLREVPAATLASHSSSSALTALRFKDDDTASIAYALISSQLVFWLWRVDADAFHVSPSWLIGLNFRINSLRADHAATLAQAGRDLWRAALTTPLTAVNKGRQTLAFPATLHMAAREIVDAAVVEGFGLRRIASRFDLNSWYRDTVVVDRMDNRRLSMAVGQRIT